MYMGEVDLPSGRDVVAPRHQPTPLTANMVRSAGQAVLRVGEGEDRASCGLSNLLAANALVAYLSSRRLSAGRPSKRRRGSGLGGLVARISAIRSHMALVSE